MARARQPVEDLDFTTDELDQVVAAMTDLSATRAGWLNIRPLVEADQLPRRRGLDALLNASLPVMAVGTWIPGQDTRKGREPDTVGVQHPVGRRVAMRLVEAGLRPPEGWRGIQDHARRGLIVELPEATPAADVLAWLLPVLDELVDVELDGSWRASIHHL